MGDGGGCVTDEGDATFSGLTSPFFENGTPKLPLCCRSGIGVMPGEGEREPRAVPGGETDCGESGIGPGEGEEYPEFGDKGGVDAEAELDGKLCIVSISRLPGDPPLLLPIPPGGSASEPSTPCGGYCGW